MHHPILFGFLPTYAVLTLAFLRANHHAHQPLPEKESMAASPIYELRPHTPQPQNDPIGLTSEAEIVSSYYLWTSNRWRVGVTKPDQGERYSDPRNKNFLSQGEALLYAHSIIDRRITSELRWW